MASMTDKDLDDEAWEEAFFGPRKAEIQRPEGAIDLFPSKIGPRIYHLPDTDQILKAGFGVKLSEAEAMRKVARETSIPVPTVHDAYVLDGNGYILMSRVDGKTLSKRWKYMTTQSQHAVAVQLKNYMEQLRSLRGRYYGALEHQPCEDVFFSHLPFAHETNSYGPFSSRSEYNDGLILALKNSCPSRTLDEVTTELATRLSEIKDETIVFSHGDLHTMNIIIDDEDRITSIIDWECAGFSIPGREYYEARSRARDLEWTKALDEIFPPETRADYELLKQVDQAMKRYTCI